MTAPLALTMGEPAGIGGEISLYAWHRMRHAGPAFVLLDDPDRVLSLAVLLGADVSVRAVASPEGAVEVFADALPVLPLSTSVPLAPRRLSEATAAAVIESIATAVRLTRDGACTAVVTNPIHKGALSAAGFAYPGHTEYLAALAGVPRTVLLLAGAATCASCR